MISNIKEVIDYIENNGWDLDVSLNESSLDTSFSVNHIIINKCKFYIQFFGKCILIHNYHHHHSRLINTIDMNYNNKNNLALDLLNLLVEKHLERNSNRVISVDQTIQNIVLRAL